MYTSIDFFLTGVTLMSRRGGSSESEYASCAFSTLPAREAQHATSKGGSVRSARCQRETNIGETRPRGRCVLG